MTKSLLESAIHQLRTVKSSTPSAEVGEESSLAAHVAARILLSLKAKKSRSAAADALRCLEGHLEVPVERMVKKIDQPEPHEIDAIAGLLAHRELPATSIHHRLAHLSDILGLDATDLVILMVFAQYRGLPLVRTLLSEMSGLGGCIDVRTASIISGLDGVVVEERLARHGRLVGMGLIDDVHDGDYRPGSLLLGVSHLHGDSRDAVERFILPDTEKAGLAWDDFEHLGPMRDLAEGILRAGKPVSILLHGEPGTGKSEFARALARQVGSAASFAGLVGYKDSEEPRRDERLGHLAMLRRICAARDDRVVVVDEADDVLELARERHASKQFVNRLVEDPKTPTIWIVNNPAKLDQASLRRMILAIHFDRPPLVVRRRIAQRVAEVEGMVLTPEEVERLAALPATAAVVASGVRAANLSGSGIAEAEGAVSSVLQAMGRRHSPEYIFDAAYDPALSAADIDLAELTDRLIAAPSRGWSLLLSGPSGTGKTAFARHLAERIGVEIEVKRASDLISPFVGETEANIADAFLQASRRGAMLLIDEADTFLYRREGGQRSWEVSMVNEMLCQMERLAAPFVATTNLIDRLDPATQRRFTLRVAFRTMTPRQVEALFIGHFGMAWPIGEPLPMDQTPGDFAVVNARAALLGKKDPHQLVRWLRAEAEARGDSVRGPVGFRVTAAANHHRHDPVFKDKVA